VVFATHIDVNPTTTSGALPRVVFATHAPPTPLPTQPDAAGGTANAAEECYFCSPPSGGWTWKLIEEPAAFGSMPCLARASRICFCMSP
jgi:hypothetical protein